MGTMADKQLLSNEEGSLKIPGFKAFSQRTKQDKLTQETSVMIQEATAMLSEASAVLQVRRWQVQEEPFKGFDSPPGRF